MNLLQAGFLLRNGSAACEMPELVLQSGSDSIGLLTEMLDIAIPLGMAYVS